MVIHDLNLAWPRLAIRPFEADAPLPVDAYRILPLAVATERFQPIASHGPQRFVTMPCAAVELGNEVMHGSGELWLKRYDVRVD